MEIITIVIAVAGFVLSLFLALRDVYRHRLQFKVDIIDYRQWDERHDNTAQFLIVISNTSAKPISITRICIGRDECELEPKAIHRNPTAWNSATTPQFPVCVPADSSAFAYLEFVGYSGIPLTQGTEVTFEIQTTHRLVRKTLLLGPLSHYLRTRETLRELQNKDKKTDS